MARDQLSIIAETAFSHEGDLTYMKRQIEEASVAGADYVKFQVLLAPDLYYHINHHMKDSISKYMFDVPSWNLIIDYALQRNLKIILLPLEEKSLSFCFDNGYRISAIELHSVCLPDLHMIRTLRNWEKTLILGVGGHRGTEVQQLIDNLGFPAGNLVLIHGFQSFPTILEHAELRKIKQLKEAFGCSVGYADHTMFKDPNWKTACLLAVALGASFIEKHVVVKAGEKRTDFESAVTGLELLKLREDLDRLSAVLGNGDLSVLNNGESRYRARGKQPVAVRELTAETMLSPSDIVFRVCEGDNQLQESVTDFLVGKTLKRLIDKNEVINPGVLK